jgi:hypothetical protein
VASGCLLDSPTCSERRQWRLAARFAAGVYHAQGEGLSFGVRISIRPGRRRGCNWHDIGQRLQRSFAARLAAGVYHAQGEGLSFRVRICGACLRLTFSLSSPLSLSSLFSLYKLKLEFLRMAHFPHPF